MKKFLSIFLCIMLCANVCFANGYYDEDEIEPRSPYKLIAGIAMTLIGGFLIYDGFSKVEEDISKPSVDYGGFISAYYNQNDEITGCYNIHTGDTGDKHSLDKNKIYNNGNVDLYNLKVYVSYKKDNQRIITDIGTVEASYVSGSDLKIGKSLEWGDCHSYKAGGADVPYPANDYDGSVLYQEEALKLVDVKVIYDYKKKYKKKNKSDIEGVAGIAIAGAGIYFIVDYFVQLNKFNQYAKRNGVNVRLAKHSNNEYKLLLSKRI